jgi:hypothetical protein
MNPGPVTMVTLVTMFRRPTREMPTVVFRAKCPKHPHRRHHPNRARITKPFSTTQRQAPSQGTPCDG